MCQFFSSFAAALGLVSDLDSAFFTALSLDSEPTEASDFDRWDSFNDGLTVSGLD